MNHFKNPVIALQKKLNGLEIKALNENKGALLVEGTNGISMLKFSFIENKDVVYEEKFKIGGIIIGEIKEYFPWYRD